MQVSEVLGGKFSGVKKSAKGDSFILFVYHSEYFSIAHGGKNDVKRHIERQNHMDNVHLAKQSGI